MRPSPAVTHVPQYEGYDVHDYVFPEHAYTKPWHLAPRTVLRMPAQFMLKSGLEETMPR